MVPPTDQEEEISITPWIDALPEYFGYGKILGALADETHLWRYMSLQKLISLLATKALHFARIDRLGDPFEGSVSRATIDARLSAPGGTLGARSHSFYGRNNRTCTAVSCWHMNDRESVAMWSQYARGGDGVCIRTSLADLAACLPKESRGRNRPIEIGPVNYVDFQNEKTPETIGTDIYFTKHRSFEHEREVRVVVQMLPWGGWGTPNPQTMIPEGGFAIPVDIERLVKQVYIAPTSSDWFAAAVQSVLDKYELSRRALRSSLDNPALF